MRGKCIPLQGSHVMSGSHVSRTYHGTTSCTAQVHAAFLVNPQSLAPLHKLPVSLVVAPDNRRFWWQAPGRCCALPWGFPTLGVPLGPHRAPCTLHPLAHTEHPVPFTVLPTDLSRQHHLHSPAHRPFSSAPPSQHLCCLLLSYSAFLLLRVKPLLM